MEVRDVAFHRVGYAIKILRPACQPFLDLSLCRRQRSGKRGGRLTVAIGEFPSVGLGELSLLFYEERNRICAGSGERAFELCGAFRCLTVDDFTNPGAGLGEVRVDRGSALLRAPE